MQEKLMDAPGIDDNYVLINGERRKNRFFLPNGVTQQHTEFMEEEIIQPCRWWLRRAAGPRCTSLPRHEHEEKLL